MIAHEMAHVIARHGFNLTKPTSSAESIFLHSAGLAAEVFTSGASSPRSVTRATTGSSAPARS
ncbi:MAG: hypothetical protein KIT09_33575 [Bryobacteraceae bacterium]|nr:hypothetical protein [Bryobacteraceae bacterium]